MDICFHYNVYTSYAVQLNFLVFVSPPVTEFGEIFSTSIVFFVTFGKDNVLIKFGGKFNSLGGFLPRVVVDCSEISISSKLYNAVNLHLPSMSLPFS